MGSLVTAPMFYRQLRKTTALLVVVFVVFLIHRLVVLLSPEAVSVDAENVDADMLETAESVICHNIVGGAAFSVDSVFRENVRVYFYSVLDNSRDSSKLYLHKWYNGLDTIFVVPCLRNGNICTSYISPDKVTSGEWSVDLVDGKRILDSRQFVVERADF